MLLNLRPGRDPALGRRGCNGPGGGEARPRAGAGGVVRGRPEGGAGGGIPEPRWVRRFCDRAEEDVNKPKRKEVPP